MTLSRRDRAAVRAVMEHVANVLVSLEHRFAPEARLTFVARVPGDPDATIVVSRERDVDLGLVADELRREMESFNLPAAPAHEVKE